MGTSSPVGRNAAFCALRYNMHIDSIGENRLTGKHCLELYQSQLSIVSIHQAIALREIIYVREDLYKLSESNFSTEDVNTLIGLLAC